MSLLIAVLAVFFVWETVLSVCPWTIPPWLQPVLVYGAALAYSWPDWRIALAVSGAVGLLHVLLGLQRSVVAPPQMVRHPGRAPRVPDLP